MARTPLARQVQNLFAMEQTRRDFLRTATAVGVAASLPLALSPRVAVATGADAPRIAVVGAGLAGLTCAYRLKQAGYAATVYEGSDRIGGRCWTLRGAFDEGQMIERGGELIDQGHTAIRHLAQELGLQLDNLLRAEQNGTEPLYHVLGRAYSYEEASRDIKAVWRKLHRDLSEASYPTRYDQYTQRGWELDHMSIIDWINESVPGGVDSPLGRLLDVAYNIEYGGESSEQSALNLLYLLGYSGQGRLRIFGPSNEKYHVRGGNDQIPARLAAALEGQIVTDARLTAIRRNGSGTYRLTFSNSVSTWDVTADHVVLTLPFSMLRHVDYSQAEFSPVKQMAIAELPMGTNTKFQLQFIRRHWRDLGCNGETFADTGYQCTWEVTRGQEGQGGILNNFTGGNIGASFSAGSLSERAAQFLQQLEPVMPGISQHYNGKVHLEYWTGNRWTRGSYSYWKVGQYTRFAGAEGERSHNCHFAGEHTSVDFQGYLNGAVETGERAAQEVLDTLGKLSDKSDKRG